MIAASSGVRVAGAHAVSPKLAIAPSIIAMRFSQRGLRIANSTMILMVERCKTYFA